eukprot:GHVH01000774.1.p1 GENE.GHVH01000774.1~~GHVH01000774.1.p1  ORF type:complete len:134 (-),score=8.56 GHVH01000774.1:292-693(-)
MMADLKWNFNNSDSKESLHLLLIAMNKQLRSIRDLRAEHIPMLEKMKEIIMKYLVTRYGTYKEFQIFFHYHPTFWHLHCHVSTLGDRENSPTLGRSHLIDDVIENLKGDTCFYQTRTLSLVVPKSIADLYESK